MLIRNEDTRLAEAFRKEVEMLLSRGIPIYHSDTGDEDSRIIKRYPDGRIKYVTFDFATGMEVDLGPFEDAGAASDG